MMPQKFIGVDSRRKPLSESRIIQEIFLNYCRKHQLDVDLLDGSGETISGRIAAFDQDSLIIDRDGAQMLYYKNGIHRIIPHQATRCIFQDNERLPYPLEGEGNWQQ